MKRSFRGLGRAGSSATWTTVLALSLSACVWYEGDYLPELTADGPPISAINPAPTSAANQPIGPTPAIQPLPALGRFTVREAVRDGPYLQLQKAARQMPALVTDLSAAIAQQVGLAGGVDQPAEQLRARLTQLLREHVYLTVAVNAAAVRGDPPFLDDGRVWDGRRALDLNGEGLLRVLVPLYGANVAVQFQGIWSQQAHFFTAYAMAARVADEAGKRQALLGLDGFTRQFGTLLADTTQGGLAETTGQEMLAMYVTLVTVATDAQVAGDATAAATIPELAAAHMDTVAETLAGAFAKHLALAGDVDSEAGEWQARLTALLTGHVFLTGAATEAAIHGRQAEFAAGWNQLAQNSQALSEWMASVVVETSGEEFGLHWFGHAGTFVTYALGVADGDVAAQAAAQRGLAQYVGELADYLSATTNGSFAHDEAAAELAAYVQSLTAAIDAQAKVHAAEVESAPEFGHFPVD